MRPCYRNNAIDTTPRHRRRDTRTQWMRRLAYSAFLGDYSFLEALLVALGFTLLSAVAMWGMADILQAFKHL